MPCNYKNYPKNWKTEIRPDILKRANNKCENCSIENNKIILRGEWNGVECYQDEDGIIYDAKTSEKIGEDYIGEVHKTNKLIKVILTIAHLDHIITNNDYLNLKALCQKCHLNYDKEHHLINRTETIRNKKKQLKLL